MGSNLDVVKKYIDTHASRFEEDLFELLHIPSVSTDPVFGEHVRGAAQWLVDRLRGIGLEARLVETERHPIVYAESAPVKSAPVVMVYGHYDVQPADPLNEWQTPPFEPQIRDGKIFARGASDDKGQLLTHVFAAEAWLKTVGKLPVQLKFVIEGEEEVGSHSLEEYLAGRSRWSGLPAPNELGVDICVISDGRQYAQDRPAITYGLRGLLYCELILEGPKQDLHSGVFGGSILNPAIALTRILARLIDEKGRVQLPGFYDDVVPLTEKERRAFAELGFDETEYQRALGVSSLHGEEGYTTLERRWARPTFEVNGIWGGYQGEGSKTIVPAKAGAKFSFRLVPDQDPEKIGRSLESFVRASCPPGVRMRLSKTSGGRGLVLPLESPYISAASDAIEKGFGKRPVFMRVGGTIPVVSFLHQYLGVDSLLVGWGQDDDNIHSPNEKFILADFHRGILASAALWEPMSRASKPPK
jgi:succinyl-diaminopimelate desuccinylase